jgi:O-antigen ligase
MFNHGFFPRLTSLFAVLYIAAGFGLFLSVADNSLAKSGKLPLAPTVLAVLFLGSITSFVLLRDFLGRRATTQVGMIVKSNTAVIFPFALLALISLALALHPGAYWSDGQKWIYLQSYDFCIFIAAMLIPTVEAVRKHFQYFVIVGLLTLLGSIWYDVQNPGAYSSVPGRASGFPGNSNWGALSTVMLCTMSLSYQEGRARLLDLAVMAVTALGLYFTFSRSGTINFVLLLLFFCTVAILNGKDRAKTAISLGLSLVSLITFIVVVIPLASKSSELTATSSKSQNRVLALADGELSDDGSAADRIEAARETLDRIENSPVFGNGTGFNRRMRQTPHNLYLKLWVDSGIFGLLTWLSLLASGFWMFTSRRYRPGQALMIATAFGCLFSHNILEQRTFLILFGTASSMSLFASAKHVARVNTALKLNDMLEKRNVHRAASEPQALSSYR